MAPLDRGLTVESLDVDRLERDGVAAAGGRADRTRAFVRCGPIFPHHELEIRDETGATLPDRRVGRAFVRGPSLMRGYFRNPEATAAVLSPDGWLDTGDLGFLVDGEFTPTGRSKDLILLNGRNVWPQDLEWTAEQELETLRSGDVAAFSVPGDDEERLVVLVQSRNSDPGARAKLADDVAALLRARHSVDPRVQVVGSHALPQTSSGKLSRSKARTLYLAGAFDAVEAV
jgi:fatty-acyl-CoA synthase